MDNMCCAHCVILRHGCIYFPKIQAPPLISWRQKGDLKHVPKWGTTILKWPVNLALIQYFRLGACEWCRSQWPRGLRRRPTATRLLRSWVLIPPGTWVSVCCECCVLSGRDLCDALITRPEESYRLWCVGVWSRNLNNKEAMARVGPLRQGGGGGGR